MNFLDILELYSWKKVDTETSGHVDMFTCILVYLHPIRSKTSAYKIFFPY